MEDLFEQARDKTVDRVLGGLEKKNRVINPNEKKNVA